MPLLETQLDRLLETRERSEIICKPLQTEDYVIQPVVDVSPPKWHLGHTTWFFEEFILTPYFPGYQIFHEDFSFVFNSYYETVGKRVCSDVGGAQHVLRAQHSSVGGLHESVVRTSSDEGRP